MKIYVKGDVVDDDLERIYEWFGEPCTSPGSIAKALAEAADDEEIDVYINSPGGSVFAGAEIYETLRQRGATVHITGVAASAASVIACAGKRTLISPAGAMMVHNVSAGAYGDYREMEQMARTLRQVNRTISSAYQEKTGKSEKELLRLMDAETWMNAADCVENGFCDAVEERPKESARPAASMGLSLTDEQIARARAAIEKADAETAAAAAGPDRDKRRREAWLKLDSLRHL